MLKGWNDGWKLIEIAMSQIRQQNEGNLFIYQARGVQPVLSWVSDIPVSAANIIYEAFVFWGNFNGDCLYWEEMGSIGKLEE